MTEKEMIGWMRVAYDQARLSPDLSTKNGAVLLDREGVCIGSGCNRVVPEQCRTPERLERPAKYDWTTHAEVDATLDAVRSGKSPVGGTLVAAWAACCFCGQVLVGSRVTRVVRHRHEHMDRRPDWLRLIAVADEMFQAAGVEVIDLREHLGTKILFNGDVVEV